MNRFTLFSGKNEIPAIHGVVHLILNRQKLHPIPFPPGLFFPEPVLLSRAYFRQSSVIDEQNSTYQDGNWNTNLSFEKIV
jgi:hypothetical protein